MKNKDLIEKLQQYPLDMEVCIFDWKRVEKEADGEPQSAGIYSSFDVDIENDDAKENAEILINEGVVVKQFIAIGFENIYVDLEDGED